MSRLGRVTAIATLSAVVACGSPEQSIETGEMLPGIEVTDGNIDVFAVQEPAYSQATRGEAIQIENPPALDQDGLPVPVVPLTTTPPEAQVAAAEQTVEQPAAEAVAPQESTQEQSGDVAVVSTEPEPVQATAERVREAAVPQSVDQAAESVQPEGQITSIDQAATASEQAERVNFPQNSQDIVIEDSFPFKTTSYDYKITLESPLDCDESVTEDGFFSSAFLDITLDFEQPNGTYPFVVSQVDIRALDYWRFQEFFESYPVEVGIDIFETKPVISELVQIEWPGQPDQRSLDLVFEIRDGVDNQVILQSKNVNYPVVCQ